MRTLAGARGIALVLLCVLPLPASAQVIEPRLSDDDRILILLDEILEPPEKRQPLVALEFSQDLGLRHIRVGGKRVIPPTSVDLSCGTRTWTIARSEIVRIKDVIHAFFRVNEPIAKLALTWPECRLLVVGVRIPIPREPLWVVWSDRSESDLAPRLLAGQVVSVVNGNTIRVWIDGREESVRYIGVTAPRAGNSPPSRERGALEARTVNRFLVEGKTVRLELDTRERDRHGRLLAYVHADDQMVNAELVKGGWAQVMTAPPNVRHEALLIRLQREARQHKRGLWADRERPSGVTEPASR